MKKVLFATSALVATAGIASADITLSGGAAVGFKDNGVDDIFTHTELDFGVNASGTADNGISFGASFDLDRDYSNGAAGNGIGDAEAFVSGAFGTVTFGQTGELNDINVGSVGFDGLGGDDLAAAGPVAAGDVQWTYSVDALSLGVSSDTVNDNISYSIGYTMGALSLTVAGAEMDNNDSDMRILASYSTGPFSITGMIADSSVGGADIGGSALNVGYKVNDALSVNAIYSTNDTAGDPTATAFGFSYNLGGGLTLAGGVGNNAAENDVADLGFKMAF